MKKALLLIFLASCSTTIFATRDDCKKWYIYCHEVKTTKGETKFIGFSDKDAAKFYSEN